MRHEANRWLRQAEADLRAARVSRDAGSHEWACFQAQQSAEKALKAFLYGNGYTSIMTHSLTELVAECQKLAGDFEAVSQAAHFLDLFYVPTRYPNGLAGEQAPTDFYTKGDAEQCLSSAESILRLVRNSWNE